MAPPTAPPPRRQSRPLLALVVAAAAVRGGQGRAWPHEPPSSSWGRARRAAAVLPAFQKPPTPPPSQGSGGGGSSGSGGSGRAGSGSGAPKSPLPFTSKLLESSSAAGPWATTAPSAAPVVTKARGGASAGAAASFAAAAPPAGEDAATGAATQVTAPGPGPFRLVLDEATDRFAFQTATIRLAQQPPPTPSDASAPTAPRAPAPARVRLVGSVHIAEPEYFKALESQVDACDLVLYEMITSERNVFRDAASGREQLGVELAATPELRRMALAHGLEPQLDNMRFFGRRHWFLSDIPKERLCALQRARGERALDEGEPEALLREREAGEKGPGVGPGGLLLARFPYLGEMGQMFWEGFTSRGKVLPKFLSLRGDLSKAPFRLLRLCMWLAPAPELQLMLLDWARQYPPAGGLSKILRSMVGALVHGDLLTLRRLAFSQMLTSSQGAPPPEVLVLERNSKVVLDVAQALESAYAGDAVKGEEGNGLEVAVLYGGLHLKDMEEKLVRHLNFTRDASSNDPDAALEWTTAWTMPAYTATRPALVAALCVALPLLYLGVGAADWSVTFGGIAHDIALGSLHPEEAPPASALAYEGVREALLYVFRHLALYWGLTRWAVEWERQLFELK